MFKNKEGNVRTRLLITLGISIGILAIILAGYLINKRSHDKKVLSKSAININDKTYEGKKIEVEGNKIIIHEENNSKTIETIPGEKEKMLKTTQRIRNTFEITDLKVEKKVSSTSIKGIVKSKKKNYKKIVINAKFYRNNKKVVSSSQTLENIKINKENKFKIDVVGDYTDCTYEVDVEYIKE